MTKRGKAQHRHIMRAGQLFWRNEVNATIPSLKVLSGSCDPVLVPSLLAYSPTGLLVCKTTLCFLLILELTECHILKHALPPIMLNQPFLPFWNAPTEKCLSRYDVSLQLDAFNIVSNNEQMFLGGNLTIFYLDQLGLYPFYEKGTVVNGGCPQNASLEDHLGKMLVDIETVVPSLSYRGLAVIDWENWRPQWVRNWDKKDVYRQKSRELVRARNGHWTPEQVDQQAQWEFDMAAQRFMVNTLRLGRSVRPGGWWGYYLFPDCYNYDYLTKGEKYTGQCPEVELQRNNQLMWLWNHSKALYPSVYMEKVLRSSEQGRRFVRARVKEAMRVADLPDSPYSLPVFVYSRPMYAYTFLPLTVTDLIHSIGESAALGVSGVVLWGDSEYSRNTLFIGDAREENPYNPEEEEEETVLSVS
ncbi:hyaluronidase-1 isoform X2 [Latimeria chalumnae]|uniref:hyaluronidase-1 isoform X2 n=1 Tax=Latimeria chalumnae TaxID=7897 RepID=UPI0003C107E0|nr:PREDICTED: hyaluronidase-1-like isoform X2 [Latimeria chalumnae]|eukprot:XP_005987095.1 PREDICTED: hyaluronidase-1-like isoform X2 [Latimeria chalumnae]